MIRITVANRGPETAGLHVLPTVWFRNNWTRGCTHEGCSLQQAEGAAWMDENYRAPLAMLYLGNFLPGYQNSRWHNHVPSFVFPVANKSCRRGSQRDDTTPRAGKPISPADKHDRFFAGQAKRLGVADAFRLAKLGGYAAAGLSSL